MSWRLTVKMSNNSPHKRGDWEPTWSPDRRQIVFESERVGHPEIYVMGVNGIDPINLTQHPAPDGNPA